MSRKKCPLPPDPAEEMGPVVTSVRGRKRQAKDPDFFTNDRDTLECINCGLVEHVLADGRLITYKDLYGAPLEDSGLRFREAGKGLFECPVCKNRIKGLWW